MTSAAAAALCGAGRSLTGYCRPRRVFHSRPLSALPPSLSSRSLPLRPPRRHQPRQHHTSRVTPAGTVRAAASSSSSSLHHLRDIGDGGGGTPALGLLDRLRAGIAFIRSVIPGGSWWALEEIIGEETIETLGAAQKSVPVLSALGRMWQLVADERGLRGCFFGIGNLILVKRLRETVFSALLFQDISFFDEKTVGNLSSRLGADCQQVSQVIGNDLNLISRNVLQGSGALIYLFILSWPLALSTLAICFVLTIIMVVHSQYQKKAAKSTQDVTASANEVVQEVLSLIRTVRVFGTEKDESKRHIEMLLHLLHH